MRYINGGVTWVVIPLFPCFKLLSQWTNNHLGFFFKGQIRSCRCSVVFLLFLCSIAMAFVQDGWNLSTRTSTQLHSIQFYHHKIYHYHHRPQATVDHSLKRLITRCTTFTEQLSRRPEVIDRALRNMPQFKDWLPILFEQESWTKKQVIVDVPVDPRALFGACRPATPIFGQKYRIS